MSATLDLYIKGVQNHVHYLRWPRWAIPLPQVAESTERAALDVP